MAKLTSKIGAEIKQEKISEVEEAFVASYANPDNLTPAELVELHIKNFVRSVLVQHKRKLAQAELEATLDTGADI